MVGMNNYMNVMNLDGLIIHLTWFYFSFLSIYCHAAFNLKNTLKCSAQCINT